MRAACQGTKRDDLPCTANAMSGSRYCWHHDPDHAEERRRNASRSATLGNSKVGAEIRSTRLMLSAASWTAATKEEREGVAGATPPSQASSSICGMPSRLRADMLPLLVSANDTGLRHAVPRRGGFS